MHHRTDATNGLPKTQKYREKRMDQENFNANQHANTASTQAELKLAIKRMGQIAAWEQIAVAKLHQANIKIAEHQAAHHQTFLRLRSCLQHVEAVEAHMKATMQARDSDIFGD